MLLFASAASCCCCSALAKRSIDQEQKEPQNLVWLLNDLFALICALCDWWQKANTQRRPLRLSGDRNLVRKCYCLSLDLCVCVCVPTQLESKANTQCFLFLAGAKPFASDNVTASWDPRGFKKNKTKWGITIHFYVHFHGKDDTTAYLCAC